MPKPLKPVMEVQYNLWKGKIWVEAGKGLKRFFKRIGEARQYAAEKGMRIHITFR